MNIWKRSQKLIAQCGTNDPERILQQLGVSILPCELHGIRGFYKRIERNEIVFVDYSLLEEERRFVLAHELGHLLLHKGINRIFLEQNTYLKTSPYEREANLFALFLLFPNPSDVCAACDTIEKAARYLGCSEELAEDYLTSTANL